MSDPQCVLWFIRNLILNVNNDDSFIGKSTIIRTKWFKVVVSAILDIKVHQLIEALSTLPRRYSCVVIGISFDTFTREYSI